MKEMLLLKICELAGELSLELPSAIITSLITSFIIWISTMILLSGQKVKIHEKIVYDINTSKEGEKWVYKFKIVNSSMLAKMFDFDIRLIGVKFIQNKFEKSHTEHLDLIAEYNSDHSKGLKYDRLLELGKYKTWPEVLIRRKTGKLMKKEFRINFGYRIITSVNLDEPFKEYDIIRLTVKYKDSLFSRTHIVRRDFWCNNADKLIFVGMFTDDGSIRNVSPHPKGTIDKKAHKE
jgi:hypothetical protein